LSTKVGEFVGQRLIGGTSSVKSANVVSDLSRFGIHDLVKCQITRDTEHDLLAIVAVENHLALLRLTGPNSADTAPGAARLVVLGADRPRWQVTDEHPQLRSTTLAGRHADILVLLSRHPLRVAKPDPGHAGVGRQDPKIFFSDVLAAHDDYQDKALEGFTPSTRAKCAPARRTA
jgi:hypothetical protein